jgi:hypothetical protein
LQGAQAVEPGEVTEQRTGRVTSTDLVLAVGDEQGQRHRVHPPSQEAQDLD